MGVLFFAGMAAFGGLVLYVNRAKWQHDVARKEQQHRVFQGDIRAKDGHERLAQARTATGEERARFARLAVESFTVALKANPVMAELYVARAEASELLGDLDAAKRDRDRARELGSEKKP